MENHIIDAIRRYCSQCIRKKACTKCVFAEYRRRELSEKGCGVVYFEAFGENLPNRRHGRPLRPAA
jgi:hypothetical protein